MERLQIRLQRPIPGVDHLNAVDPERFAWLHGRWDDVAGQLDVDRINDFYVYEGRHGNDPTRWFSARDGLTAIRAVLEYCRAERDSLSDDDRAETIDLFESVESVLDDADLRNIKFCFVGNY